MKFEQIIAQRPNKTIYRDGDACIKLFNEEFSKSDVLNEALNQARVEESGLFIPKIREVTKIDGQWAIISDYVEGETLWDLMEQHPEKMEEYIERFVNVQLYMHTMRAPLLTKHVDKMSRKIDLSTLDASTKYDLHTRLDSMPRHNKLCHGDFHPSNIIITPDDKACILDWSHATQGNASADAARSYLVFNLQKQEALAKAYLRKFCEKSNTAIQYVQSWLPIVAASQSVKGNAEEREFLLSWVNVYDYE